MVLLEEHARIPLFFIFSPSSPQRHRFLFQVSAQGAREIDLQSQDRCSEIVREYTQKAKRYPEPAEYFTFPT
jgi:hypothetical protein